MSHVGSLRAGAVHGGEMRQPAGRSGLGALSVRTAQTPQGIEISKAGRNDLASSLSGLVTGHLFGRSAARKADDIVSSFPRGFLTEADVASIKTTIKNDPERVKALLHHTSDQCGNAEGRATSRAVLVAILARHGLDSAEAEKSDVIGRDAASRKDYFKTLVPDRQDAGLAAPRPREVVLAPLGEKREMTFSAFGMEGPGAAFGGAEDAAAAGRPEHPRGVYVSDKATAEAVMSQALGTTDRTDNEGRVAWTMTKLGATRDDYLLSHSFAPCVPLVVFWKGEDGVQKGTLFHFNGAPPDAKDIIGAKLSAIDPKMRIQSFTFVERLQHGPVAETENKKFQVEKRYIQALTDLAAERGGPDSPIPLHVMHSERGVMSIAVDVRTATVMATTAKLDLALPAPDRD